MGSFLQKLLEVSQRIYAVSAQTLARVYAFLGSVNIDQPRGVLLCVALQSIVLLGLQVGFRRTPSEPILRRAGAERPPVQAIESSDAAHQPIPTEPSPEP